MCCVDGLPEQRECRMQWHVSLVSWSCQRILTSGRSFDYNDRLGLKEKDFLGDNPKLRADIDKAWLTWAKDNLTDDEGGDEDDEKGAKRMKVTSKKEKIRLRYSKAGEPLLPRKCLDGTLDEKKDLLRAFLTAHYGGSKSASQSLALILSKLSRRESATPVQDVLYPGLRWGVRRMMGNFMMKNTCPPTSASGSPAK
jgi:hypothetical protein